MEMNRLLIPPALLLLAIAACGPQTGGTSSKTAERTIVAFADGNGNGEMDNGEAPLPDVLVIADSNIHGSFTRLARKTDADGQVVVSATYTHYFDVKVIAPCGYAPTTATAMSAIRSGRRILFGFSPQTPQAGTAAVRLHLWEDADQDSVQDPGEAPISGEDVLLDIRVPDSVSTSFGPSPGADTNEFAVRTDAEGRASIDLGNSCGSLRVQEPVGTLLDTVSTNLPVTFEEYEGERTGVLSFEYGIGETAFEWGLTR